MGKSKIVAPAYKKTGYPRQQEERQIQHIADTIFADLFSQASISPKRSPKRCNSVRQTVDNSRPRSANLSV